MSNGFIASIKPDKGHRGWNEFAPGCTEGLDHRGSVRGRAKSLYSLRHDGPLPAERELTLEALKMFDEAMRPDPLLPLPASPNWAVGFLSGFIQSYVEGESQKTEPLPQVAKEEA